MEPRKPKKLVHVIPALLYYSGFFWCWRFLKRNKITILMVHGVVDDSRQHLWQPLWARISLSQFDATIQLLTRHYTFISLSEAADMIQGKKKIKPYSMVVTFDDGYKNNIVTAQPVLEKYNIPASIFLATGFIGNKNPFWIDRLDYALQAANVNGLEIELGNEKIRIDSSDRDTLQRSYFTMRQATKAANRPDHEMQTELARLSDRLEQDSGKALTDIIEQDDWAGLLNWDDVATSSELVTYGAHTVDHVRLEYVDPDVARQQIDLSKQAIEQARATVCNEFCYPNGSYNTEITHIIAECGFRLALTSECGLNGVGDNLYTLKRVPFPVHDSPIWILSEINGLIRFLAKLANKLFGRKSSR